MQITSFAEVFDVIYQLIVLLALLLGSGYLLILLALVTVILLGGALIFQMLFDSPLIDLLMNIGGFFFFITILDGIIYFILSFFC